MGWSKKAIFALHNMWTAHYTPYKAQAFRIQTYDWGLPFKTSWRRLTNNLVYSFQRHNIKAVYLNVPGTTDC